MAGDAIGGSNILFFSSLLCVSGVAGDAIGGSNIQFLAPYVCLVWLVMLLVAPTFYFF